MKWLLLTFLLAGGCASWQGNAKKACHSAFALAKSAHALATPIIKAEREKAITACVDRTDRMCPELQEAHKKLDAVTDAIKAVHYSIQDTLLVLAIAEKAEVFAAVYDTFAVANKVREQVCDLFYKHNKDDDKWKTFCGLSLGF